MDRTIELVPLVCVQCDTPVPAGPDEAAWVCAQCQQGLVLDEGKGLLPLEVNFAADIAPGTTGRPYWVSQGRVNLAREAYGSSGKHSKAAEQFWSQTHTFFIPAYTASLEEQLSQATKLLLQPPALKSGVVAQFNPVTLSPQDVLPAAEFIVMAIEAQRKDNLKALNFNLELSEPVLWILA